MKHLTNALKEENNTLQKLNLGGSNIGNKGAKCIAEMLVVNKTLQEIRLGYNIIGDEGAKSIATSLVVNTGIRVIELGQKIGDKRVLKS